MPCGRCTTLVNVGEESEVTQELELAEGEGLRRVDLLDHTRLTCKKRISHSLGRVAITALSSPLKKSGHLSR
jgi:hypothetical protein